VVKNNEMVTNEARSLNDTYMEQLLKQFCSHYNA